MIEEIKRVVGGTKDLDVTPSMLLMFLKNLLPDRKVFVQRALGGFPTYWTDVHRDVTITVPEFYVSGNLSVSCVSVLLEQLCSYAKSSKGHLYVTYRGKMPFDQLSRPSVRAQHLRRIVPESTVYGVFSATTQEEHVTLWDEDSVPLSERVRELHESANTWRDRALGDAFLWRLVEKMKEDVGSRPENVYDHYVSPLREACAQATEDMSNDSVSTLFFWTMKLMVLQKVSFADAISYAFDLLHTQADPFTDAADKLEAAADVEALNSLSCDLLMKAFPGTVLPKELLYREEYAVDGIRQCLKGLAYSIEISNSYKLFIGDERGDSLRRDSKHVVTLRVESKDFVGRGDSFCAAAVAALLRYAASKYSISKAAEGVQT